MELSGHLLPASWPWLFGLVLLPLYGLAVRWANWRRLREQVLWNVYFGSIVGLLVLWSLRTGVQDGLVWHLSGMVFLTLMWGWSLALIGGLLALTGLTLAGVNDWAGLPPSLFLEVLLPATLTQVVLGLVRAYVPKHFFVFVFINAFFCAALVAVLQTLTAVLLLDLAGVYDWAALRDKVLVLIPLLVFPEAFINGGVITVLVGLRPEWVWSFRDEEYIDGH